MGIKAKPTFSLKDQLFNASSVGILAARLKLAHPSFRQRVFVRQVLAEFPKLELKQRIHCMVNVLESHLPKDFVAARAVLEQALPEPLDPNKTDNDFGKFIWVVPGEYVAKHGCSRQHLKPSLNFLRQATRRFSSEWAIRPFLQQFPDQTLAFIHQCAVDDHYHVRRLASEGIRPFLPWGQRVLLPTEAIIEVLDQLHGDNARFVTRSVANTLNDISKIDAASVVKTLRRWRKKDIQSTGELDWMTRHALRTLLKASHPPALKLLNYTATPNYTVSQQKSSKRLQVGRDFVFSCLLESHAEQKLKIGLRIHFLKANGCHKAKVFSLHDIQASEGQMLTLNKRLSFKPMSTRTLYPGVHYAELMVNGIASENHTFILRA